MRLRTRQLIRADGGNGHPFGSGEGRAAFDRREQRRHRRSPQRQRQERRHPAGGGRERSRVGAGKLDASGANAGERGGGSRSPARKLRYGRAVVDASGRSGGARYSSAATFRVRTRRSRTRPAPTSRRRRTFARTPPTRATAEQWSFGPTGTRGSAAQSAPGAAAAGATAAASKYQASSSSASMDASIRLHSAAASGSCSSIRTIYTCLPAR